MAQWYSAGLWARWSGVCVLAGAGNFSLHNHIQTSWPTQRPIQWVPDAFSLGVKRPVHDADHSSPPSAEHQECMELYLHSHNTPSWRGAQLKRGTRTTTLPLPLFHCGSDLWWF